MEAVHSLPAGDSARSTRALSAAVRVFERCQPGSDPAGSPTSTTPIWRPSSATAFATPASSPTRVNYAQRGTTGSARSDLFVTIVLAAGHLGSRRRGPPSGLPERNSPDVVR